MIQITMFDVSFILLNVYGPTSSLDKALLWKSITLSLQDQDQHQVAIGGDFNALL